MSVPLPTLVLTSALVPFALIAFSMVGITIFLLGKVLPSNGVPPLLTQMVLALAVLGGGSLLLLALLFVYLNPDGTEAWTWVLLAFNFMMMAPAGLWFIGQILFRDHRIDAAGWPWPVTLSIITTGSEALMGVLYVYAAGAPIAGVDALAAGLSSVWFFWSMAAVMAALLVWAPLGSLERWALLTLTGSAFLGPWVTSYPTVGGISMSALMGASFIALLRALLRGRVAAEEGRLLLAVGVAFLSMAIAGLGVAVSGGAVLAALAFGSVMGAVMGVEVAYLIRRYFRGRMSRPWLVRSYDASEAGIAEAEPHPTSVLVPRSADRPVAGR